MARKLAMMIGAANSKSSHWHLSDFEDYEYYKNSPFFKNMFPGQTDTEHLLSMCELVKRSGGVWAALCDQIGASNKVIPSRCCRAAKVPTEFIKTLTRVQKRRNRVPVPYPF